MPIRLEKITKSLEFYDTHDAFRTPVDGWLSAICYVQLGEFERARLLFESTTFGLLQRHDWLDYYSSDRLTEVWALSARADLHRQMANELERYRGVWSRGDSPMAMYSYALFAELADRTANTAEYIESLLRRPRLKLVYALGQALQAIAARDGEALHGALIAVLRAHEGAATHGMLRWSAEGYLSMPAMALAIAGRKRGLRVDIKNDYFSQGYVDYVLALEPRDAD